MTVANTMMPTDLGPDVEKSIAFDMIRRSLPFIPVILLASSLFSGLKGVYSAAFAIVIVLANFALSALMMSYAARVSLALLGASAFFGFIIRLGLITVAVLAVRNQAWVRWIPLCVTLIFTHLGLLVWELRFVSASFAYPGLKPRNTLVKE
jgi:hypothetical protein